MWFEILPSVGIITVALAVPHVTAYVMNKLVVGNMFRRSTLSDDLKLQYMRDMRLSGDPYVVRGLESIPDE